MREIYVRYILGNMLVGSIDCQNPFHPFKYKSAIQLMLCQKIIGIILLSQQPFCM